jgi:hypothetical protein
MLTPDLKPTLTFDLENNSEKGEEDKLKLFDDNNYPNYDDSVNEKVNLNLFCSEF